MEPVLNLDPVTQWFHKYLLPSEQIPEMAACTTLSPLAEPFVPRDPDGVFWPGQLLSDSSCHDWSNDAQTQCQMSHLHTDGLINVDTHGREATTGPPARRPIGYERAHKREQQKAETPGPQLLGDTSGIDEHFDVGVGGKSYSCEITAAFLEGLQGGSATLREGGFCPGQYTRFSGVTLWDKLTSDRSFNDFECMPRSTDTDTSCSNNSYSTTPFEKDTIDINNSYSAGLSSDASECVGSFDDTQNTSAAACSDIERRTSSPGLDIPREWPRQVDVPGFTYPLTSLDLLIVKDHAGAMRSLQDSGKSDPMRSLPGHTTPVIRGETKTDHLANVLALPFNNHAYNNVLSPGGNILSDASVNDAVKSQEMTSSFGSASSLHSEDIGRKGLENETSDTPSLSRSNTGSTGYSSSGSDDGHLTSCSSRFSLNGFSSDGRSSVDSGLGLSISDLLCVAAEFSHARQQLGDDWPEGQRVTDSQFCADHPDKRQNLYCASCLRLICSLCFAAHHMDCAAVLTHDRACRALRWQLVKLQSSVDTQISDLEARARALRGLLDSSSRSAARTKDALNEHFQNLLVQLETRRRELMAEVDAGPRESDRRGGRILHRLERALLVLNYVRTFVKVLRQRDSAWELLMTFDSSLSHLLTRVMQRTTACSNSVPTMLATPRPLSLDECQLTALQVALDGLGLQEKGGDWRDGQLGLDLESGSFIDSPASPACDGQWTPGGSREDGTVDDVDDKLLGEVLSYLNRFPPPVPCWPGSGSGSTASNASSHHEDLDDEVFESTEAFSTSPNVDFESAEGCLPEGEPPRNYRLQQRLCPDFPQDEHRSFIIDIHLSETGQLVLLDAANHCLKRIDPRKPSFRPFWVHVHQPLGLCSAGWDRVLVSRVGCALDLYSVGGEHVRLLANRNTRRQYVGVTRASDALVAAACPETHSVDLLDFSGRLLRSVMPISFHVGPKVVGATAAGELLVVHQPAEPPTTIFCFDMSGRVIWRHELRVRGRHVLCSKVIEGHDGGIIFLLQEQSTLYSFSPKDGVTRTLLTPEHGIKFPSGLAQDRGGKLYVARTELLDKDLALFTAEIDVYANVTGPGQDRASR